MIREYLRPYRAAWLISCILYLAACALPATKWWGNMNMGGGGTDHYVTTPGITCLLWGWVFVLNAFEKGFLAWLPYLHWLANPLALVAAVLLLFRRPTGAAVFGVASAIVAALYVFNPPGFQGKPPDLPQVGAWLWMGSLLALTIAALIRRESSQAQKHSEQDVETDPRPIGPI